MASIIKWARTLEVCERSKTLEVLWALDLASTEVVLQAGSKTSKTQREQEEPAPEEKTKRHGVIKVDILSRQRPNDRNSWTFRTFLAEQCGHHRVIPRGGKTLWYTCRWSRKMTTTQPEAVLRGLHDVAQQRTALPPEAPEAEQQRDAGSL